MTRAEDSQKVYEPADPEAAVDNTNHEEPVEPPEDDNHDVVENSSSHSSTEKELKEKETRPPLNQTKSHATTASALTRTESHVDEPRKKPWYRKLNPLRWGSIPPVPETRGVSREYNAPFLSLVYFQWMAPLMTVGERLYLLTDPTNIPRLATSVHSSRTTFGL